MYNTVRVALSYGVRLDPLMPNAVSIHAPCLLNPVEELFTGTLTNDTSLPLDLYDNSIPLSLFFV